jgi:hypothetical protein
VGSQGGLLNFHAGSAWHKFGGYVRKYTGVDNAGQAGDSGGASPLSCKYYNNSRKGVALKSVEMCESGSHMMVLHKRGEPGPPVLCAFRCGSWRHEGTCRQWKGAQDFVRARDAMLSRGPHWVYLVLTLDRRAFASPFAAYVALCRQFQKLNQRLSYLYGPVEYILTVEAHQSGFPHLNVVIHNESIWELCEGDRWRSWRQVLIKIAVAVGFGRVLHVSPLWDGEAARMAGYFVKLSSELTGAGVKNQVPVNAPPHFRRLRASRGLLPPIYRPGTHIGSLTAVKVLSFIDLSYEAAVALDKARAVDRGRKEAMRRLRSKRGGRRSPTVLLRPGRVSDES